MPFPTRSTPSLVIAFAMGVAFTAFPFFVQPYVLQMGTSISSAFAFRSLTWLALGCVGLVVARVSVPHFFGLLRVKLNSAELARVFYLIPFLVVSLIPLAGGFSEIWSGQEAAMLALSSFTKAFAQEVILRGIVLMLILPFGLVPAITVSIAFSVLPEVIGLFTYDSSAFSLAYIFLSVAVAATATLLFLNTANLLVPILCVGLLSTAALIGPSENYSARTTYAFMQGALLLTYCALMWARYKKGLSTGSANNPLHLPHRPRVNSREAE